MGKKYLVPAGRREDFLPNLKGSNLQSREEHVTTFAYWNDKNDCPGWGTAKEEDLH